MAKQKLPPPVASLEEAKRTGWPCYIAPRPCDRGHFPTIRYTVSGHCVDCRHLQYKEWHAKHPEKQPQYAKKYYDAHYEALYAVARKRIAAHHMLMPNNSWHVGAYRHGWWSGVSKLSNETHWMPLPEGPL